MAHLLCALAVAGTVAVFMGLIAFAVLKVLGVDHVFAARVGIAEGAVYIGVMVGALISLSYFLAVFPPYHSAGLRKGHRCRVKELFKAGADQFQAGDVLIFKGEWKIVDYQPETEDEEERMGREYFQFFDESILGGLEGTTSLERVRHRAAAVRTITNEVHLRFYSSPNWIWSIDLGFAKYIEEY